MQEGETPDEALDRLLREQRKGVSSSSFRDGRSRAPAPPQAGAESRALVPAAAGEEQQASPWEFENDDVSRKAPVLGVVHSFLGAAEAQDKVLELSCAAEHYIVALLFTFDREDIMTAWTDAVRRGVR